MYVIHIQSNLNSLKFLMKWKEILFSSNLDVLSLIIMNIKISPFLNTEDEIKKLGDR